MAKIKGPFKAVAVRTVGPYRTEDVPHLQDVDGNLHARTETMSFARRIAAALNAADAEESRRRAKPTNQWGTSCKRDGWSFDVYFGGEIVDHIDVVKLLNELGARPGKRRPAIGGAK